MVMKHNEYAFLENMKGREHCNETLLKLGKGSIGSYTLKRKFLFSLLIGNVSSFSLLSSMNFEKRKQ